MYLYLTLFAAIAFEVTGTMLLPTTHNFTKVLPTTILLVSYALSFYFLALVSQSFRSLDPLVPICLQREITADGTSNGG